MMHVFSIYELTIFLVQLYLNSNIMHESNYSCRY